MVDNVIEVVNYVSAARPSLLNFMIADTEQFAARIEITRAEQEAGVNLLGLACLALRCSHLSLHGITRSCSSAPMAVRQPQMQRSLACQFGMPRPVCTRSLAVHRGRCQNSRRRHASSTTCSPFLYDTQVSPQAWPLGLSLRQSRVKVDDHYASEDCLCRRYCANRNKKRRSMYESAAWTHNEGCLGRGCIGGWVACGAT
jgi:hypothetical protein